jgi:uncharacterized protein with GYD domain
MQTFIILTKFAAGAFEAPAAFRQASAELTERLKRECPGVHWKASFATLGRYDVVDIVEAERPEDVHRAAILVNTQAHASTETLLATPWHEYLAKL